MIWPLKRHSHPQGSFEAIAEAGPFLPDRFAFKLFRELVRANDTSNVFFSPFSVLLCLMMVWEDAGLLAFLRTLTSSRWADWM